MKTVKSEVIREYYDNGQIRSESYRIDGKRHNPHGPAIKIWYENGQIQYEEYYIEGKLHNPNGPAIKSWYENGRIEYEQYWINGQELTKKKFNNRSASCNGKVIEVEGKKYQLIAI